jgi:four helix bundle protein
MANEKRDLAERLFQFAATVIKATRELPVSAEYNIIKYQLIKAATSVGANYEESQAAVSSPDFSNKIGISLKEIREANYFIRLLIATTEKHELWIPIRDESKELMNILGAIYTKASKPR